jgi:hypothetical protein
MTFDGYGHMALSAHWLILAAVWLFLRSTTTHAEWMALLLLSIGVTFYFFVIVGIFFAVWSARNVSIAPNRTHAGLEALRWTLLTGLCSVLLVFVLGGFQSTSFADSGLGVYRATIASLVDATTPTGQQWTRLLLPLDLATPPGGQEGFGYLGSGVIALVVVCAILSVRLVTTRNVKKFTPLLIVAVFFLVLSLSPRIGFATYDFVSYPLPPAAEAVLGVVRATGRFVWVPMYVVVFLTIAILSARFRSRKHVLVSVLLIAVVFQVVDSSVALSETRERFTQTDPWLVTDDPVWNEFVMDKSHLVSIPPLSNDPRWIDLAVLAHRNNMTTSAAYVSRKDEASFEDLVETTQQALELRKFRSDTLYVITNYPPNPETTKLFEESEIGELMNVRVVQVEELTVVYSTSTGS